MYNIYPKYYFIFLIHNKISLYQILLAQDGRIIVYGGVIEDFITPASDPLLVLDTTVQPFKWSIPDIKYTPNFAPSWRHTATLVGNYMIVAFGMLPY
jgi:hypothetical protein